MSRRKIRVFSAICQAVECFATPWGMVEFGTNSTNKCSSADMRMRFLVSLLALACLLSACAQKAPVVQHTFATPEKVADLREFPQNLQPFAQAYGPGRRLLSAARQAELTRQYENIFFGPWHLRKTSISRRDVAGLFGRARGYKNKEIPWTESEWQAIRNNANLGAFPSRAAPAIILRATDLREVPTSEPRFSKPTPDPRLDPFDYIQYSLLHVGMPVFVAHTSLDGRWHYIECPLAGGWVDAADVAFVDGAFRSEWRTGKYAALIAEKVNLPGTGANGGDSKGGIGVLLPVAAVNGSGLKVLLPRAGKSGFADIAETPLAPGQAATMPMPLTAGNVAQVGDKMMGEKYGWGGMFGNRDCSAMLRDLFTPFGWWLPRNSVAQARRGHVISLAGMSTAEKERVIARDGKPFLSLVGMKGHITLYIGQYKGRPAIFHNAWGLRIVKDGNDDERMVIGKAVVTSITPGKELKELYQPVKFEDRLRTLTTPRDHE